MSNKHILTAVVAVLACLALTSCGGDKEPQQDLSNKAERNFIREGNKLFAEENYADAEIEYSKALQANPSSAIAAYNMGLALAKQAAPGDSTGIQQRADSLFNYAASITNDKNLKSMAHYNMGNLAYENQQYNKAINDYKNALRAVPSDEDARYNLRMAQLKLQEQQQQQQNKDQQNQDQNQDQNQQNQDQNKDNQNQDQQDKNQDQNKDQQGKDQQGDQDKAKQDQGQQQQGQGNQGQQQGQPINMDERSIQQVLKAMADKEKETQQKIYQMGERQKQQERRATQNKW